MKKIFVKAALLAALVSTGTVAVSQTTQGSGSSSSNTQTTTGNQQNPAVMPGSTTSTGQNNGSMQNQESTTQQGQNGTTQGQSGSMSGRESRAGVSGSGSALSTGKDLAASASLSNRHTILLSALKVAGLADRASSGGPYTVFAPTDEAFNRLPSATLDNLLKPAQKQKLTRLLGYHVVEGSVLASDLQDGQKLTTLAGETLTVKKSGDRVMIVDGKGKSANVVQADIQATNGVVHSIDSVLMSAK